MKRVLSSLGGDWEKAILWSVMIVAAVFCLSWLRSPETDAGQAQSVGRHGRTSLLGPDAWAFLANEDQPQLKASNDLFRFSYRPEKTVEKDTVIVQIVGKEKDKEKEKDKDMDKDVDTGTGNDDGEHEPPAEPPQKEFRTVRYLGIYIGTTGKRMAAVEIRDPKTGQTRSGFWDVGSVANGIRLEEFDGNALRFLAPDGASGTVARGAETSIQLPSPAPTPN